jgi:hypothetical protein
MANKMGGIENGKNKPLTNLAEYAHNYINALNNSKLFAGLMIIILNIASRFVTVKLSKSMESYLKYTFSRQILIFAIAWMGTRDIYIAIIITLVFMICIDFLFNEDSKFCILPAEFTDYHHKLHDSKQNEPASSQNMGPNMPPSSTNSNTTKMATNLKNNTVTEEEIQQAKEVLEKAKQQNVQLKYQSFYAPLRD